MDPTSCTPLLGPCQKPNLGRGIPRPGCSRLPSTTSGGVCGWLEPLPWLAARSRPPPSGTLARQRCPLSSFTPPRRGNDRTGRALRWRAVPPGHVQDENRHIVVLLVTH